LQIVERTGEHWFAAELYRHKGKLLQQQGYPEAAEDFYRQALSIAKEQQAKLWELRAAISLARLGRDQGRRSEARDLLAPVYGWFTEGFDTPDLKELCDLDERNHPRYVLRLNKKMNSPGVPKYSESSVTLKNPNLLA
jgi:predicted ATPase